MPIFDYILLAILGAGGTVTAPLRTIDADAVRQPPGGAISDLRSASQSGQKKWRINPGTVRNEMKGPDKKHRRHRRRHRPKPDSFTVKQK